MKKYSLMIICCMVYSISIWGQTTLNTFNFPDDTITDPRAIGELVINEMLADPGPLDGDANGDGIRDAYDDEFVEIINGGLNAVDMSNYSLSDATGVRHIFPPGTILPSRQIYCRFWWWNANRNTGHCSGCINRTTFIN